MSIQQNFPNIRPSLNLNFARSQKLDPRITFTRTSSATRVNSDGLIEVIPANSPRFDFDPLTGECLGLLVEEQRSNLWVYSENPESAFFQPELVSFSSNSAIAPDGNLTADKIISPVGADRALISQGINISSGATLTGSAFVKYADLDRLEIVLLSNNNTTPYARATINPINGTITTVAAFNGGTNPSASVVSYGNGWYRFSVTVTYPAVTLAGMRVVALDSGGALGDGTKGTFVWGMQLEVGSFPTSYIPTSGTTATRTADNASITGSNFSDFYNPSEGTVYTQFKCDNWNVSNSFGKVFTINEGIFGVENNGFWIGNDASTSNSVRYRVRTSGTNQFGPANLIRTSNIVKSALSVKTSDFAVTIDGNTPTTSTSGTLSTSMTNMTIGRDIVGIDIAFLNGHIAQLTYYPARLPNQILQNLTK